MLIRRNYPINNDDKLRVPLFTENNEPEDYELYIYGTLDVVEYKQNSFGKALKRYLDEAGLTQANKYSLTQKKVEYHMKKARNLLKMHVIAHKNNG